MDTNKIASYLTIRSTDEGVSKTLQHLIKNIIVGVEPITEDCDEDMASTKIINYGGVKHSKLDRHGQPNPDCTEEEAKQIDRFETAISLFLMKLIDDQKSTAPPDVQVVIDYERGRKYDKVLISDAKEGKKYEPEVRYFVNRKTGEIFGAKSPTAPNERHFFNTIFTAAKWDWSEYYGKPVTDDSVREIKRYGEKRNRKGPLYIHYELVGQHNGDDPPAIEAEHTEELVEA